MTTGELRSSLHSITAVRFKITRRVRECLPHLFGMEWKAPPPFRCSDMDGRFFYKYDPLPNVFVKSNLLWFFFSKITLVGGEKATRVVPANTAGLKSPSANPKGRKSLTVEMLPTQFAPCITVADFPPAQSAGCTHILFHLPPGLFLTKKSERVTFDNYIRQGSYL